MSKKTNQLKGTVKIPQPPKAKEEPDPKKEKWSESISTIMVLYFMACFGITAYAQDHTKLTYGQISVIYLPMFFIFLYWQCQKLQQNAENGHTRMGNYVAVGMCLFIIVVTAFITVGAWIGVA